MNMRTFKLRYGKGEVAFDLPEANQAVAAKRHRRRKPQRHAEHENQRSRDEGAKARSGSDALGDECGELDEREPGEDCEKRIDRHEVAGEVDLLR